VTDKKLIDEKCKDGKCSLSQAQINSGLAKSLGLLNTQLKNLENRLDAHIAESDRRKPSLNKEAKK